MKIKVLTIINKLNLGGIEKTLLSSIQLFKENNIEIHVLSSNNGYLDKQYKQNGAILHHYNKSRNPVTDAIFLYRLLKTEDFDVVHSREGHNSGFLSLACKLASVPIIVSVHSEQPSFKLNWKTSYLKSKLRSSYLQIHKRLTLKYSSLIIGHSKINLEYFNPNNIDSDKYKLVYNGIDFAKFQNDNITIKKDKVENFLNGAKLVFLHIGSFREQKNHSFLIDVFSNLSPKKNKYKLILVGDGELQPKIINKVEALGLEQYVYFAGLDLEVEYYFNKSNVFFFPSLNEGFGNVLIEAQYNKLLILASNIKAFLESVYSGYQPYLYDPTDADDASRKINDLINNMNYNQITELKNDAYVFSQNFSIETMVENLIVCYNDVLRKAD